MPLSETSAESGAPSLGSIQSPRSSPKLRMTSGVLRLSLQDLAHGGPKVSALRSRSKSQVMLTVGRFEVTLYGRFWVTPEESRRAPGSGHTVEDAITAGCS